ncbi:MAG: FAD-dependent monooxygenase, partial [Candidatus Nanopelagicales bacterium]|nr:FAD-dependent monooxygenase [Candidatus Nanopelagicales bacterium]
MNTADAIDTDVLVVGAGPAGAAAAAWAARGGLDVVLADAEAFPRDKPCGDGLTPRAIAELDQLGMLGWLDGRARNKGLRAAGFGQELYLPWPGGSLPNFGGAAPRLKLDAAIRQVALDAGARPIDGHRAVDVEFDGGQVRTVHFSVGKGRSAQQRAVTCRRLIVADGAKSQLGRR